MIKSNYIDNSDSENMNNKNISKNTSKNKVKKQQLHNQEKYKNNRDYNIK